jgi:hypothetical protein
MRLPSERSSSIQATEPGQRPDVSEPEVGQDALEREDDAVEGVVVEARAERVEDRRDRPRPAVVERRVVSEAHCVSR